MRKRVHIALVVLLVMLAGVSAWQGLREREREPLYQGKRLSVWLRDSRGSGELTNAVRQIGTNGIPTLLKMLRKKDSPSVLRLTNFWDRHIVRFRYLPAFIQYPDWYLNQAHRVNASALIGFEVLGADAQQAVPALIKIYEQHNSPLLPDFAGLALIAVGPKAAIPLFVRDTGSSNLVVREGAVMALWNVYIEPRLVLLCYVESAKTSSNFRPQQWQKPIQRSNHGHILLSVCSHVTPEVFFGAQVDDCDKQIRQDGQDQVVMKPAPAAPFEMIQAQIGLSPLEILFDVPA